VVFPDPVENGDFKGSYTRPPSGDKAGFPLKGYSEIRFEVKINDGSKKNSR
jgi:hypothetical protein